MFLCGFENFVVVNCGDDDRVNYKCWYNYIVMNNFGCFVWMCCCVDSIIRYELYFLVFYENLCEDVCNDNGVYGFD